MNPPPTPKDQRRASVISATKHIVEDDKDFESILMLVGARGRYQKLLLYTFLTPVVFLAPFFLCNSVFLVTELEHWCEMPEALMDNLTVEEWKTKMIPLEVRADGKTRYSKCRMFTNGTTAAPSTCQYGWDYDRTDYEETLVSEYDWVCDKAHYATYALTVNQIGTAVGTIIFGTMADRFGRKSIFFPMILIAIVFRVLSVYVAFNFVAFLVCQFVVGAASALVYNIPALLLCEVSHKDYRGWIYSFTWTVWVVSFSLLPVIAWATRRWDSIALITSVPGFVLMFFWPFVVESPRWLLSQGKLAEAKAVMLKMARVNKREAEFEKLVAPRLEVYLAKQAEEAKKHEEQRSADAKCFSFARVFRHSRLLKNLLYLTIMDGANNILTYGLALNTTTLHGNQFINYIALGVIEIPASIAGGYFSDKFGRRWTQVFFYFVCTLTTGGSTLYYLMRSEASPYIVTALAITAKFAITVTFLIAYLQVTEVFPTSLRSTFSGLSNTIAFALCAVTPFVVHAGKSDLTVTYAFFTGFLAITCVAAACVPETLGRKLPETADEANQLGKTDKFWSYKPKPPAAVGGGVITEVEEEEEDD